jgi:GT2 family glycosyltransferase
VFSVIVPSFNHAPYLAAGVASALRSPLVEEVVLVDDGSRDGSRELVARLGSSTRVRALADSGENRGAARRLNQLVEAARCDWIAVLNSDDTFVAGRFEVLRRHCADDVDLVCGHLSIQDADGRVVGTKRGVDEPEYPFPAELDAVAHVERGSLIAPLANQNFIATTSNMVFRRSLHERVGGFRDYRYTHDWDFALRAAALGRCRMLPHYLTVYRTHASNTISESKSAIREEVQRLFQVFLGDFPEALRDPAVGCALRGNAYLDAAWLDAIAAPAEA